MALALFAVLRAGEDPNSAKIEEDLLRFVTFAKKAGYTDAALKGRPPRTQPRDIEIKAAPAQMNNAPAAKRKLSRSTSRNKSHE